LIPFSLLLLACLLYVLVLFAVAFWVEKRPEAPFLRSPLIYTLSLSIYCTAWTFFGAVGYAARSGLEFLTIYLGPSLVFMGWPLLLRKMLQIGQRQQITSIADMIAARFGKSNTLGVLVTLLSVAAATPYIALQLQSVTLSFQVLAAAPGAGGAPLYDPAVIALWVAVGLALFTILFGTRKLDLRERHAGIVMAIALEAVVKLVALIAVGLYALWGPGAGLAASLSAIAESGLAAPPADPARWLGLIILSGAAVLCLPRMFHVTVVEATDTRHLHTAAWAFPAYLLAMSLFVLPIAVTGLRLLPAGSNPDLFVLSLPLAGGQDGLALLAFLGGFSAATSMVIVATMALATMVSNHIVVPLWLRLGPRAFLAGDVRHVVLAARRLSICVILALGYAYFLRSGGSAALAAIGLTAFAGVAQILPALVGGLFWRGATRFGAVLGLGVGSAVWVYTLLLPTLAQGLLPESFFALGPFGLSWARPEALFGVTALDPLTHAVFWSLTLNSAAFGLGSLLTFPGPVERAQGAAFVNVFEGGSEGLRGWSEGEAEPEALLRLAQRILGEEEALAFFEARAKAQGKAGFLPDGTPAFLDALEVRLAGSVGAATAHAMLAQATGRAAVTVEDLLAVASEAQQMLEYSATLEAQQEALGRSARALAEANDKLTQLSEQKDNFLSQISHELRTPMTSIRAFSEMLRESDLPPPQQGRYAGIIHEEAIRLTGLLDDLLDLSVLERGAVRLSPAQVALADVIDRALAATEALSAGRAMAVLRERAREAVVLQTDPDRLTQVLINLIRNAQKYCDALLPELRFTVRQKGGQITLDIADNGGGIPQAAQGLIFEKFARLREGDRAGGAGLGLAICKEIMGNLGGSIRYLPGQGGAAFRLVLPLRLPHKPGRAGRA
jgi:Na+/proline symporter/nitrogen-specific signal transduction histidine kinase